MSGFKTYVMAVLMAAAGSIDLTGVADVLPDGAGWMTIALAGAIAALRHAIAGIK